MSNVVKAFDMFSQLYCQKFNGQMESEDLEAVESRYLLGMYKLRHDIIDEDYKAPLEQLKRHTKKRKPDFEDGSLEILWWILFCICLLLNALYAIGAYCIYFNDPQSFRKQVSN